MSEDLFPIADAKFREDVGRDDNEYTAYMAGFRAGATHARITPPPATAEFLAWAKDYGPENCEPWQDRDWMERFVAEWTGGQS